MTNLENRRGIKIPIYYPSRGQKFALIPEFSVAIELNNPKSAWIQLIKPFHSFCKIITLFMMNLLPGFDHSAGAPYKKGRGP